MENQTTVLIVDDEACGREALEGVLFAQGYQLEFAHDGQGAIEKARETMPDVILLDVMMPQMDGYEVCRRLRADNLLSEIPIVMVTALDDRSAKIKGIEAGADDFISKPFDRVELRARIRTITRLNRYRRLLLERVRFAWVVEQTREGYLILDADDHICYANPAARELFNLPDEDDPQGRFRDIAMRQYLCEPEESWKAWPDAAAGVPLYLIHPETAYSKPVWLSVDVLALSIGDATRRLLRVNEVSEKLALQRDIQYFNRLITHKLRTPTSQMVMAATLLHHQVKRQDYESMDDLVEAIIAGSKRLEGEVAEVFEYLNAPKITKAGAFFSIAALESRVRAICDEYGVQPAQVSVDPAVAGSSITLSERAVDMILREVIENAKKFHPRLMPALDVNVQKGENQRLRLRIMDDGTHISPENLKKAWMPYYQGEKELTGEVDGMGLGLASVANLVWEVGGKCRIANREDKQGVVIDFLLPTA